MKIVRMRFKSALRIGADQRGIGKEKTQEVVHSDTIFSMLVNSCAEVVGGKKSQVDAFIASVKGLSSGFLFENTLPGKYLYYLPRPVLYPANFLHKIHGEKRKRENIKFFKECSFINYTDFLNWASGKEISLPMLKKAGYRGLYKIRLRPHHARDRLTEAAAIYHIGEMFLAPHAGIYFIIENENDNETLESILHHASMNGIGGRRYSLGAFTYEVDELDETWQKILNNKGDGAIAISLFYPSEAEKMYFNVERDNFLAYELVPRKGWTFSAVSPDQFKRKTCWMFGEGSVFRKSPLGELADVTPDAFTAHKIYRFGKCLSLPYNVLDGGT